MRSTPETEQFTVRKPQVLEALTPKGLQGLGASKAAVRVPKDSEG